MSKYVNLQTFDCHTFPPLFWCSSKTDLKLTVSELKNYQGKNYAITLEVTPFCGKIDHTTGMVFLHSGPAEPRYALSLQTV